ncbi:transcobalamin-1-like [Chiloscyllium plagiosum]|uniref:transcobalamin-1-like n=1 Tax=Chiloscyllium plagiosum TaxID=36176 RepID=UPI001CB85E1B|nr:transcobalamin-1-like [Chiloscyllium plagiosum]
MGILPTLFVIVVFLPHGLQSCGDYIECAAQLENKLADSLIDQDPDPSVVLSLCLVKHKIEPYIVNRLKEIAISKGPSMTSGKLAQYILALICCCKNPTKLTIDNELNHGINLESLLSEKLGQEIKSIEMNTHPLTTYYQVALAVLALCQDDYLIRKSDIKTFAQAVMNDELSYRGHFSVDTGAMAAMAFSCLQGSYKPADSIKIALTKLIMQIYCAKEAQGTIGNIYSTGLAMQALIANSDFIPFPVWNTSKITERVVEEISQGAFSNPEMASQILPPLLDKTYLEAGKGCYGGVSGTQSKAEMSYNRMITVDYTVNDGSRNHSTHLTVHAGTVLIDIMEIAQARDPEYFRFKDIQTSLGPFITSIGGIPASSDERTFWQFLNGTVPIPVGVAEYKPSNGEHVIAKLSKY